MSSPRLVLSGTIVVRDLLGGRLHTVRYFPPTHVHPHHEFLRIDALEHVDRYWIHQAPFPDRPRYPRPLQKLKGMEAVPVPEDPVEVNDKAASTRIELEHHEALTPSGFRLFEPPQVEIPAGFDEAIKLIFGSNGGIRFTIHVPTPDQTLITDVLRLSGTAPALP